MQRIFPADWKGGSPRLSAKVSANGPISRGGNDRSCKESKVLGRLKMLVTSVEKKPDMQKHIEETCDWFFKKMTVPSDDVRYFAGKSTVCILKSI